MTFCFAAVMQRKFRRDVDGHSASHNVGDCGEARPGEHTARVERAGHTKRVHCCAVVAGNLNKTKFCAITSKVEALAQESMEIFNAMQIVKNIFISILSYARSSLTKCRLRNRLRCCLMPIGSARQKHRDLCDWDDDNGTGMTCGAIAMMQARVKVQ